MNEQPIQRRFSGISTFLYWVLPLVPFLLVYYRGLWCWFYSDDFSLLLLAALPEHEFWQALFEPRAQGTFRPLSERLFFYAFYQMFGLDAFPYRAWVFGTQILNLWLLAAVTMRLTGRSWAGFGAACLWGVYHGLSGSMTWTSAYNQVLCAFFFLLSFWLFLRFAETGRRRFYFLQWITFLLGFGALETMVVYPVVVLAYSLLIARRYWKHGAVMLPASAAFAWLHLSRAPTAAEGVYGTNFGVGSLLEVFWHYTQRALAADEILLFTVVTGLGLLVFVGYQAWRDRWAGVFFLLWFAIALAPYLPLPEHRSDYYLVLPSIGLAMAGGWASSRALQAGSAYRLVAAACVGMFVYASADRAQREVSYFQPLSLAVKQMVSDVSRARAEHPGKTILITNMPEMMFYFSMGHDAFKMVNVFDVYLTPDNDQIRPRKDYQHPTEKYFYSPQATLAALKRGQAVVYDASGPRLLEITDRYAKLAPLKFGSRRESVQKRVPER